VKLPNRTVTLKIPNYSREAFTEMLIAGENTVPGTDCELLIDEPFFYSHEWDVEKALRENFNRKWRKRQYAAAVHEAECWRKEAMDWGEPDDDIDAVSIFKRDFRFELRLIRLYANIDIALCWVRLLKHRPEYVDRCPWHFFQGDQIWETLRDEEFLCAIKHTPRQLAEKMDLNAMTSANWDEVIEIVPELAARRPKKKYDCFVF